MSTPFFPFFEKFLSDGGVHFLVSQKFDDQPVGKAHDVRAAGAEAALHAVVVRAVGPGDGDLAALDGDGIPAVHGEFLVDHQVHGFDFCAFGGDPGEPGLVLAQQGKAQGDAHCRHCAEDHQPVFRFHGTTSEKQCRERPACRSGAWMGNGTQAVPYSPKTIA